VRFGTVSINQVTNWKYGKDSYINVFNKFYPIPAKLNSARPNTDFLFASNGVCTKRDTAQLGLLLLENEVNKNLQT